MKKLDINYIKNEFTKIQNYFLSQRYDKVIEKTLVLLKKDPHQSTFYNYIALSYRQLGQYEKAEQFLRNGLKKFPNSLSIICNLAALYRILIRYEESENYFLKGFELKKNDFNLLINYANLKKDQNKNKDAINLYKQAYDINNNNETLLINLAGTYQIDAEFELSKKILREVHKKFPKNAKADLMYSSIHKYTEEDVHRDQMIKKTEVSLSPQDKVYLYFAIAKSYSDIKNYQISSEFLIKANNLQNKLFKDYKFKNELDLFDKIKKIFQDLNYKKIKVNEKPDLIFIVGLPRSGTTLAHQIISSHSEVYGAGELPILGKFFANKINDKKFLENFFINNLDNITVKELSNELSKLFKNFSNKIILDKSPLNFLWIGFIKILFPKAKIIHCKRNLGDTALSIFKNYFDGGSIKWGYNDKNLIDYINSYQDLMNFWDQKFENEIYHLEYENLVKNNIDETKKIISFCSISWEESCLDHTKNNTGIKTVSISQAREPIYKSSVRLSDNYLNYFEFLKRI